MTEAQAHQIGCGWETPRQRVGNPGRWMLLDEAYHFLKLEDT